MLCRKLLWGQIRGNGSSLTFDPVLRSVFERMDGPDGKVVLLVHDIAQSYSTQLGPETLARLVDLTKLIRPLDPDRSEVVMKKLEDSSADTVLLKILNDCGAQLSLLQGQLKTLEENGSEETLQNTKQRLDKQRNLFCSITTEALFSLTWLCRKYSSHSKNLASQDDFIVFLFSLLWGVMFADAVQLLVVLLKARPERPFDARSFMHFPTLIEECTDPQLEKLCSVICRLVTKPTEDGDNEVLHRNHKFLIDIPQFLPRLVSLIKPRRGNETSQIIELFPSPLDVLRFYQSLEGEDRTPVPDDESDFSQGLPGSAHAFSPLNFVISGQVEVLNILNALLIGPYREQVQDNLGASGLIPALSSIFHLMRCCGRASSPTLSSPSSARMTRGISQPVRLSTSLSPLALSRSASQPQPLNMPHSTSSPCLARLDSAAASPLFHRSSFPHPQRPTNNALRWSYDAAFAASVATSGNTSGRFTPHPAPPAPTSSSSSASVSFAPSPRETPTFPESKVPVIPMPTPLPLRAAVPSLLPSSTPRPTSASFMSPPLLDSQFSSLASLETTGVVSDLDDEVGAPLRVCSPTESPASRMMPSDVRDMDSEDGDLYEDDEEDEVCTHRRRLSLRRQLVFRPQLPRSLSNTQQPELDSERGGDLLLLDLESAGSARSLGGELFAPTTTSSSSSSLEEEEKAFEQGFDSSLFPPDSARHSASGDCTTDHAFELKKQFLRLIQRFCDRVGDNTKNKRLFLSLSELNHLALTPPPEFPSSAFDQSVGLLSLLVRSFIEEPLTSPHWISHASVLEGFLRGSEVAHQRFAAQHKLVPYLLSTISRTAASSAVGSVSASPSPLPPFRFSAGTPSSVRPRTPRIATPARILRAAFDLLSELVKHNLDALRVLNQHLVSSVDIQSFLSTMIEHVEESSVFIRSMVLTLERLKTSQPATAAATEASSSSSSSSSASEPRVSFAEVERWPLCAFFEQRRVYLLSKLLRLFSANLPEREVVCIVNTALIFFLGSHQRGELARLVEDLRVSHPEALESCSIFRQKLHRWRRLVAHNRLSSVTLEHWSSFPLSAWSQTVELLCGSDSRYSLGRRSQPLPVQV